MKMLYFMPVVGLLMSGLSFNSFVEGDKALKKEGVKKVDAAKAEGKKCPAKAKAGDKEMKKG